MKTINIMVSSTPTKPQTGYADHYDIHDNGQYVVSGHCSTCPNPFKPKAMLVWQEAYGWIATGKYTWECVYNKKFGKCLIINGGGNVPSRVKNTNHNGLYFLSEVYWHKGGIGSQNPEWRGSAGCITSLAGEFDNMISFFSIGERGELAIRDFVGGIKSMYTKKDIAMAGVNAAIAKISTDPGKPVAVSDIPSEIKTAVIAAAKQVPPEYDPAINRKKGMDAATLGSIATAVAAVTYETSVTVLHNMPGESEKAVGSLAGLLASAIISAVVKMIMNKLKISKMNE